MALGPEDLFLTQTEIHEVDQSEKVIDKNLFLHYVDGETVCISIEPVSKRIENEIIRRYKAAGWSQVRFKLGEYHENIVEFTP